MEYTARTPANWNENIRIGVVPTATSITIGSAGDYTIRAKTSGAVLMTGSNGSATVTLTNPAIARYVVQVICANGASLQVQIDRAIANGLNYMLEPIAACTRLLIVSAPGLVR